MRNDIDGFIKSLSICREVLNNHAQEKKKCLRGNHSEEYWREEGWRINSLKVRIFWGPKNLYGHPLWMTPYFDITM